MHESVKLPLFPLPNVVHFPLTELRLHIFEPRYRQLVKDLAELSAAERRIGMVLLKRQGQKASPEIYRTGTAGRLVDVDYLPDGRSNIALLGEFRFTVDHELDGQPYRQAAVTKFDEPAVDVSDPEIITLHTQLIDVAANVAREVGKSFPFDPEADETKVEELEPIVNHMAANLDLPPLFKLQLLDHTLQERTTALLSVLRGRQSALDLLRPFRHLAQSPEHN